MTGHQPGVLDAARVKEALTWLSGWDGDPTAIRRSVTFPSFMAGIEAVQEVAEVAEERDHHPDIDVRWRTVTFACATHSAGGVTKKDIELAAEIDRISAARGGR